MTCDISRTISRYRDIVTGHTSTQLSTLSMAKGIFPQMSIPDITNALAGWGLSVSHEQLVRPSSDFVEAVYCACLQQVTDIDHDSLRDSVQNALITSSIEDKVRHTCHFRLLTKDLVGSIYLCVDQ